MRPELSRPIALERIDRQPDQTVEASREECSALAVRLKIAGVLAVSAQLKLQRRGDIIMIEGWLTARVVQDCIVTLEPFEQTLDERFEVHLVPAGTEDEEPGPDEIDQIPYTGHVVDLGEVVAEQLALVLDPYPRSPGAELPEQASEGGAFGALAGLRGKA